MQRERERLEENTRVVLLEKQQQRDTQLANMKKAKHHYIQTTQARILVQLKQNVAITNDRINGADKLYAGSIKKNMFRILGSRLLKRYEMQDIAAISFNSSRIYSRTVRLMKNRYIYLQGMHDTALRFRKANTLSMKYKDWQTIFKIVTAKRALDESRLNLIADSYAKKFVPKRYLRLWQQFVHDQQEAKWREFRRDNLRKQAKVLCVELACVGALDA